MAKKREKRPAGPVAKRSCELSEQERAAAARWLERTKQAPPAPKFKVDYDPRNATSVILAADHAEPSMTSVLLADALSTGDLAFADGLLDQLANVARAGKQLTARELNSVLAYVHGIAPRDPTEALLAAQMVAIHNATMMAARKLNHVETIIQQDSVASMLTKLARTFAMQIEALKRYRATGVQSVRVTHQHVNVTADQAVVGVNQGGGGANENPSQSHAPSETGQSGTALLGHEQAVPFAMPIARREGPDRVPDARRQWANATAPGVTDGRRMRPWPAAGRSANSSASAER
jgi:hypothetical protein